MAFCKEEPFGGTVDDFRAGLGPAMAANLKRREGTDPIMPLDFFPWHDKPAPEPQSRAELEAQIRKHLLGEGDG